MTLNGTTETALELLHDLVQSIVSALEARDPHTAEHSLRVGDMTERTVQLMGMEPELAIDVHMAAHVHDIGKIALPDAVLHRNRRLTPYEHELLRDHARMGAEILGRSRNLSSIADIVRHHHERWDGKGFPDGLAGEEIPLGSRIICVIDSIDAMLGKRSANKTPLTQQECRQEIELDSGKKFDPQVAAFVLVHWDEIVGQIDFNDSADAGFSWQLAVETRQRAVPAQVHADWMDDISQGPSAPQFDPTWTASSPISRPLICNVPQAALRSDYHR